MKITLVRHGQTDENYYGRIQGSRNILLNDTGRRQCQRLRLQLLETSYDACYMSPLVRTVETAMILIGDRVEMIPDRRLVERNMGELEGKDRSLYDASKYWNYDENCGDLGIEKVQDIFARCRSFLNYIMEKYEEDSSILIVSHGAPIRCLHHLLHHHTLTKNLLSIQIGNCYCETIHVKKQKF